MSEAFTRVDDLFSFLQLDKSRLPASLKAAQTFPFRVPRSFAARMEKGKPDDPLLRQVLPSPREFDSAPDFVSDPVGDRPALAAPGVLRKYHGRALLIATGGCAVHCRYCFRREFPYSDHQLGHSQEAEALRYLGGDPTIEEVILSGGDPLMLSDKRLCGLIERLSAVGHLKRLRIHTRLPIAVPSRITAKLVECLRKSPLQPVIVVHANHANEIDREVIDCLASLRRAGVSLLNQSVLLRAVNDSADALIALSKTLFRAGVLPYYLHLLDKTIGTSHFDVTSEKALELLDEMRKKLPGYLVPRMVREQQGAAFKIPIESLR